MILRKMRTMTMIMVMVILMFMMMKKITNHKYQIGAVHILRQPPEGGEGVSQMLTIADERGREGQPNADDC